MVNYQYDEYGCLIHVQNSKTAEDFTYDDLDNLLDKDVIFTGLASKSYAVSCTYIAAGVWKNKTVTLAYSHHWMHSASAICGKRRTAALPNELR